MVAYKNITPTMTDYSTPSPYVVKDSGNIEGSRYSWKVFDQNYGIDLQWSTLATTGYVTLDFNSVKKFGKYSVRATDADSAKTEMPKDWQFQGSNDETTQTTLDTQTNQSNWANSEVRTYTFTNNTKYRYCKFNVTANNGNTGKTSCDDLTIYEIQELCGAFTIFFLEAFKKYDKLWTPKLILPKEGFSY